MSDYYSVYARLPAFAQDLACSLYGYRENGVRRGIEFRQFLVDLRKSDFQGQKVIADFQDQQIEKLVKHCYETVPYYHRVMVDRGLVPKDIRCRADLVKLPILTKDDVRVNGDALISTKFPKAGLIQRHTSGTTGSALDFYTPRSAVAFQWAVWWRHRMRFGSGLKDWSINFTGKPVVPVNATAGRPWRWNWIGRQALVNMAHIKPVNRDALLRMASKKPFGYYSGYPSIIARFCELVGPDGIPAEMRPRAIFLGAENCTDWQRKSIIDATGARVTDQYGFSEGCGNASRCEHDNYHEDWEFGCLDCVERVNHADGTHTGEIVATGFANWAFPMLRYRVGDTATWDRSDRQCQCGRHSAVLLKIEGRSEDYVVTPEGAKVMRFDYLFKDTVGISEAQVVQKSLGSVDILIVVNALYSEKDSKSILEGMKKYISPTLTVNIVQVGEIPKSLTGKFRPVVSHLDRI